MQVLLTDGEKSSQSILVACSWASGGAGCASPARITVDVTERLLLGVLPAEGPRRTP